MPSAPTISDGQHPDPVALRPLTCADVDAEVELCGDEAMRRWTTVPVPYGPADAEDFVDRAAARWADGTACELAVDAVDDDGATRLAGNVGLSLIGDGAATVGFALAPWARGRGVMSRAVRLLLGYGFDELGLQVVHWRAHEGNWASRRVAWACGFRVEGLVRGLLGARGVRYDGWVGSIVRGEAMSPASPWFEAAEITGERVVLRPWREDDVPRVAEACADPLAQHWLRHLPSPYTLADAQAYVRSREEQHAGARAVNWCVADRADDRCLASMTLFNLVGSYPEPEIGYWTHPEARGRGLTREAVRLVVRHAVVPVEDGGLGLPRVTLRAAAGNQASNAIALAVGMRRFGLARRSEVLRDGTPDDLVLYDVLAAEVLAGP